MTKTPQTMLLHWEQTAPDHVLLNQPIDRQWKTWTWREAMDEARRITAALRHAGLQPGDRVAIFSKNCAHWFMADFALMLGGYISVPIYPTANAKTLGYVLEHSEARACFVGKLDATYGLEDVIPEDVLSISFPYPTLECTHAWDDLLGAHDPTTEVHEPDLDDTMTVLYTSGSTGNPKGAVHPYRNFAFAGERLGDFFDLRDGDRVLSYLPLAHCTERAYVEAPTIYHSGNVHFTESLDTFAEDLKHTSPTFFGSVPRLWKRFQLGVLDQFPPGRLELLSKLPIIKGIVARKIREGLGLGDVRWFGSGTAPIAPALLDWYERYGMPIHEGWGMTESFAYGTSTPSGVRPRIGTIGQPLPETEIRIGDGDEILLKTPCLMTEYFKEPEMTAATFTEDGWLKTGDCGRIDDDGWVTITGRAKEIFKTAKGKYVAPVPIESLLAQNPLVEQVCVVGLGMTQPIGLVQLAMDGISDRELARQRLADTLKLVNEQLESHERLSRLIVVEEEWSVENGLLTPTMKLKRDQIEGRYGELVTVATGRVAFEIEVAA
ncbi:MAG: AMP-binding protein [Pseudomonadota bacterium]